MIEKTKCPECDSENYCDLCFTCHTCLEEFNKQQEYALHLKIQKAIEIAIKYGGFDGAHHKNWCIDQMVRQLAGFKYDEIVKEVCHGEDGPNTYTWDCGIAP